MLRRHVTPPTGYPRRRWRTVAVAAKARNRCFSELNELTGLLAGFTVTIAGIGKVSPVLNNRQANRRAAPLRMTRGERTWPKQKYRADQIGSFLRPQEIRDAHTANVKGELSLEELRKIEDAHISRLLEMQKQTGIDVYSDGEWRRGGWASGFAEAMAEGYVPGTAGHRLHGNANPIAGRLGTGATANQGPAGRVRAAPAARVHRREARARAPYHRPRVRLPQAARARAVQGDDAGRVLRRVARLQPRGLRPGVRQTARACSWPWRRSSAARSRR